MLQEALETARRRRRRRRILAVVLVLLALVLAAAAAFLLLRPAPGPVVDPAAVDYSIPGYDNPDGSERGRIRVPTYSAWTMEAGSDTVEVPLVNTEGNPCYMKFAVKLKDSGEVLYESELVPPGKAVPRDSPEPPPWRRGTYPRRGGDIDLQPGRPGAALNGAQMGTEITAS